MDAFRFLLTHHPQRGGLDDLQLVNEHVLRPLPRCTLRFSIHSVHKPNLDDCTESQNTKSCKATAFSASGNKLSHKIINQHWYFLASKCSLATVRALCVWTPFFFIALAQKADPRVTAAVCIYATDAHCNLVSSWNLVSKHEEHILIQFSAQCGFCTSIKLPQSWGPKHSNTTSSRNKSNIFEWKKEYLFIWSPRYLLCGALFF